MLKHFEVKVYLEWRHSLAITFKQRNRYLIQIQRTCWSITNQADIVVKTAPIVESTEKSYPMVN